MRYSMIEAGHAAENIFLQAEAPGLGAGIVGAFSDREVIWVARLRQGHEPLLIMPVGYKKVIGAVTRGHFGESRAGPTRLNESTYSKNEKRQMMNEWIAIIILGIIEGITEFLPISSTAHLLIVENWLPRQTDLFNIVIQSGAVLAVLPLFPERLHQFVFQWRERATQDYALKIILAVVITGIGGFLLDKAGFKLPERLWPVAWAMLIGGIAFLVIERWLAGRNPQGPITWTIAMVVGIGQLIAAVFPGTSRSGATILLMLVLGLSRPAATEFSFLVGIPTMLAAGGLKIFQALRHPPAGGIPEQWDMVILGFVVSAAVSFIAVRWLLRYIQTHTFVVFGWYRIALGTGLFLPLFIQA